MASQVLLCIEDRPQLLEVRKARLERLGYSVATASSAHEAIAALETTHVAAVLVQYKSEGMDAQAVAYLIKQRYPNQPVILLSAYSDMPQAILWLVDEYVMKSDPPERLTEAIRHVTDVSGTATRDVGGAPYRYRATA